MKDESDENDRKNYPTTTSTTPTKRTRESPDREYSKCDNTNDNTTTGTNATSHHHNNHHSTSNKEQDRFLPIANVGRIMKKVIPGNGKISKEAKETVQECVSEFISFVTGEASDKCQREKRKTINGDDIIWAITTLGFEDYVGPLKSYLQKYREIEGEKLNLPKQQRVEQRLPPQQQLHHQDHGGDQSIHQTYDVYSSINNLISPSSFVPTDHQAFSLSFSPTSSIPKHLQQHDELDSVRHWQCSAAESSECPSSSAFPHMTAFDNSLVAGALQSDLIGASDRGVYSVPNVKGGTSSTHNAYYGWKSTSGSASGYHSNYMDKCSGGRSYLTVDRAGKVGLRSLKSLKSLAEADWKSINPPKKLNHREYRFWMSHSTGKCLTVLGAHGQKKPVGVADCKFDGSNTKQLFAFRFHYDNAFCGCGVSNS
ncbi:Nuclear transcription factor Y subunit B-7 [Linum grandiflorum]